MSDVSDDVRPVRLGGASTAATDWASLDDRPSFYFTHGKRAADIGLAVVLLVVLSPLLLLVAVIVALDGASPIYVHRRVGLRGRSFGCVKFRSMVPNANRRLAELLSSDPEAAKEWERDHKLSSDPRVTWIGAILRKFSIDELPQLWCVLVGDMSLVGPRPVTEAELDRYGPVAGVVLSARPGVTGLWQVYGRGLGASYAERIQMDAAYVRSMNWRRDSLILLATILVVLRGTGT